MNRYNIKIDGDIMPNSYTYEELVLNGIFEFDDIEVKKESKSNWTNIKSYYFPEEHEEEQSTSQDFYVDENGQAHFNGNQLKKQPESEYVINEFGEMVRRGSSSLNSSAGTTSSATSSTRSSSTSSSSSDGNGWKIFLTIVAIIVFIVITCTTGWGSIPAGIVGYWTLKSIWGNDL